MESDEGDARVYQEYSFLSPPLLTFVDWLFHKAINGSKHQYETNVAESVRQVFIKAHALIMGLQIRINPCSLQGFLDFVREQHNAADAREQLKAYMKKYVASKYSDGTAASNDAEAIDPLAAMGFKGKASLPPAAGAASPRRAAPAPAAAAGAASAGSAAAAGAGAAAAGPASPSSAATAAIASSPSTGRPAGANSASPAGRQVSTSRIAARIDIDADEIGPPQGRTSGDSEGGAGARRSLDPAAKQ